MLRSARSIRARATRRSFGDCAPRCRSAWPRTNLWPPRKSSAYWLRWRIEQVFRSMKSDGLRLEETQVQEASRLFKLAAIALTDTDLSGADLSRLPMAPVPFPMRSQPGVGKPDGPSRLAGSNLLPPVPRSFW
jgi:hypothetical protein